MKEFLSKAFITSAGVIIANYLISGIHVNGLQTAILVAVVLGLLNTFVKPILILLTIPITILTLGLFLIVINILIIKWVATLVPGFKVDDWWAALLFSIVVSIFSAFIQSIIKSNQEK